MENLILNFDEVKIGIAGCDTSRKEIENRIAELNKFSASIDSAWHDAIDKSSYAYIEKVNALINELSINKTNTDILIGNITKALETYSNNEETWAANISKISF